MIQAFHIALFLVFSVFISIYDIKKLQIPLLFMYAGVLSGFIFDLLLMKDRILLDSVSAAALCFIFLLCQHISKQGLGFGDVQYSLFCGFFSGFPWFIISSFFSAVTGIIFFLILSLMKKDIKSLKIPFAPFMSLGTLAGMILSVFFPISL